MTNPFDEETDAAKDNLDLDGEFDAAKRSGGDVELKGKSGGDVEAKSGGDVEAKSGGDVEVGGDGPEESGGDVEAPPAGGN
ncbi:hypothetical protein [Kribbella monticola]|uniref:hypothetical protein n=1 Tax=Kribbella monticola TaxID=2185285 RepID=UPI000DD3242B|nr:hypothetical protein [Kribbella monticola]